MNSQATIALVEDNEDDLFFMLRALKEAEIVNPLRVLKTGREAIDYLSGRGDFADRTRFPLPFLLLLDLKLPDMSGFDILRWVRSDAITKSLPIIVLTNSGEARDLERAYQLGSNSFLVKPSGADGLLEQMKALKSYWIGQNGYPRIAP